MDYDVHWKVNESEIGGAAQDHGHISNGGESKALDGHKCKQTLGEAAATGQRRERTALSPLRADTGVSPVQGAAAV